MNLIIEMSILIAAPILVVWALRVWYKHQGASGMAQTTGKGLEILASVIGAVVLLFGKAALIFARAGARADAESDDNPVVDHFNHDTVDIDGGPGSYYTKSGSIEYRTSPYS